MPEKHEADEPKIEEAIKVDVKSLQQISSSGRAARRKREENHAEKAFSALDAAFEKHLKEGNEGAQQSRPGH
ncbi:uncharacterized protein N7458_004318 [Penicillium daleae]|uniref:Uncharacterized protein n=1 Tax=Penicillium daleae TaxID=63821 RepID=A0AAD6G4H3_9EURO|nr:uncharacterized protein N7458_004318 [Penicillium daleae]KAJ5456054.1 hypothetical protein N7458_004318 [Penicillium daleae]